MIEGDMELGGLSKQSKEFTAVECRYILLLVMMQFTEG